MGEELKRKMCRSEGIDSDQTKFNLYEEGRKGVAFCFGLKKLGWALVRNGKWAAVQNSKVDEHVYRFELQVYMAL